MGPWEEADQKDEARRESARLASECPTLSNRLSKTFWTGVAAVIIALATPLIMLGQIINALVKR